MTTIYRSYQLEPINPDTQDYTSGNSSVVSFTWSSSDLRHWLPARSYLLAEVELTKADGSGHDVALSNFWPQKIANRWTHLINGSLVQAADKPYAANFGITTTKNSFAYNETITETAFGFSNDQMDGTLTKFGVAIRPPLPLWVEKEGVPGAHHELTLSLPSSEDIAKNVYSEWTDELASIKSLRLFVATAHPQNEEPLKPFISYPLRNLAIYTSSTMTEDEEIIETLTVPRSTWFVMVYLALATDSRLSPVPGNLKTVGVRFRGVNKPSTDYTNIFDDPTSTKDQIRAFVDTVSESRNLAPDFELPFTFDDWLARPYYAFDMSKRNASQERELQIRATHGSTTNHKLVVMCFYDSMVKLKTENNKVIEANFVRDSI